MRVNDLERILTSQGYHLARLGIHRVWSNGNKQIAIPHGREINRMIARRILKELAYQSNVPEVNYYAKKLA